MGKPGFINGRHYSDYVEKVKNLKWAGLLKKAEDLLLKLVEATEAEAEATGGGGAPWYYEQLAIIYRKRRDYAAEVSILERFMRQPHAPGTGPQRLSMRLKKAQRLLQADNS